MHKKSVLSDFVSVFRKRSNLGIILLLAAILAGCVPSKTTIVEEKYITLPFSYTDDVSRKLAVSTYQRLPELYEDYRVGAEDVLEISIFEWELRAETKSVEIRVSETGRISLPVVGEMNVKNHTVEEIKAAIETRLKDWHIIPNPRVSVVVQQFRSKRVAVVGAVGDPGTYTLRRNVTTFLDILSLAGGPSAAAGQVAYVLRNIRPKLTDKPADDVDNPQLTIKIDQGNEALKPEVTLKAEVKQKDIQEAGVPGDNLPLEDTQPPVVYPTMPGKEVIGIDLYELMELGNLSLNVLVGDEDVIHVPEAKRFHIIGFAQDPGTFTLKKPTTVLEGIAMARGMQEDKVSKRKCAIKRKTAEGEIIMPLNLVAIQRGKAPNIYLQPDDIVLVRQTFLRKTILTAFEITRSVVSFGFNLANFRPNPVD